MKPDGSKLKNDWTEVSFITGELRACDVDENVTGERIRMIRTTKKKIYTEGLKNKYCNMLFLGSNGIHGTRLRVQERTVITKNILLLCTPALRNRRCFRRSALRNVRPMYIIRFYIFFSNSLYYYIIMTIRRYYTFRR